MNTLLISGPDYMSHDPIPTTHLHTHPVNVTVNRPHTLTNTVSLHGLNYSRTSGAILVRAIIPNNNITYTRLKKPSQFEH